MSASLADEEYFGLKIACAQRSGLFSAFSCKDCTEVLQEKRNCKCENRETPVHYDPDFGSFYACPVRYVPNSIWLFLDDRDYLELYPTTAEPKGKQNPRFWEATKQYMAYMAEFRPEPSIGP